MCVCFFFLFFFVRLSFFSSACLVISQRVCIFVNYFVCIFLLVFPLGLFVYLFACFPVCLCICLFLCLFSSSICFFLFIPSQFCIICFTWYLHVSVCVCVSLYLYECSGAFLFLGFGYESIRAESNNVRRNYYSSHGNILTTCIDCCVLFFLSVCVYFCVFSYI